MIKEVNPRENAQLKKERKTMNETPENPIATGSIFRGILLGLQSIPWKKDASKFNHKLGLSVKVPNDFGGFDVETKVLEVPGEELPKYQKYCEDYKGQLVEVSFIYSLRTWQDSTFLNEYIPKNAVFKLVSDSKVPNIANRKAA